MDKTQYTKAIKNELEGFEDNIKEKILNQKKETRNCLHRRLRYITYLLLKKASK